MRRMKRIKELLTIAMLAVVLVACTTVDATPGADSQAVPSSPTQGTPSEIELEAVLEVPATLPSGEAVDLRFTMINNTDTRLYVLKWYTPLEGIAGEIFRVERDGKVVPYEGILAYRGDPPADAYILLDPRESVSAQVDLAAAYDFSEPGEYTIAFISPRISHVARTEGEMATSVDDLGPVAIPSNQVTVTILQDSASGEEATNPDLTATLESPTSLPNGETVKQRFTLTNNSDADLYILKWFTPLEGLGGEIFRVKRDGQPLPYEGPLAMRGDPTPDAYVLLDAGASVSATVDLAAAYDFSKAGEYTVKFLSPRISHAASTESELAKTVDDLGPVAITSNQVSVTILEDL
jgi:hypothetical protein